MLLAFWIPVPLASVILCCLQVDRQPSDKSRRKKGNKSTWILRRCIDRMTAYWAPHTPMHEKTPKEGNGQPTKGVEVKEDDKRLSSWCWSRSRVASLHCPLSSPAVLFQWRTDCNLHPCHVAWGGVEFICLLHKLEVLTIGELDLNRFHGFNLSLIC